MSNELIGAAVGGALVLAGMALAFFVVWVASKI